MDDEVPLAIGMKAMVTFNVDTEADLTNGARGTIVEIVLDPVDEGAHTKQGIVRLQKLPIYVLVKLEHSILKAIGNLEAGVIPVEPAQKTFSITCKGPSTSKQKSVTVKRRQLPITSAYSFTDYRSMLRFLVVGVDRVYNF